MKKNNILTYLLFLGIMIVLQSCQSYSDGRLLKKFVSRFNAEEYASAATYVYPGDRMNVAFFANEVKTLAPHTFLKLEDYDTEGSGENRYIKATFKWENTTPALKSYFNNIGLPLDANDMQTVNLKIRATNDGETMTFPWGIPNILPENLWIANKGGRSSSKNEPIKLYTAPSAKANEAGKTYKDLIVGQEDNAGWRPAYQVTKDGEIITYYIPKDSSIKLDRTAFFHLGIFDSVGVIVAIIILIVIVAPFFLLRGVIESIFSSSIYGPFIVVGLILAAIYVIYQLLEQILFEMFIINLPY